MDDDRVRCDQHCRNFDGADDGRCLAAKRGERKDVSVYYHPVPDLPRRCEFFAPHCDDPDQRAPRERWPLLCALYAKEYGLKRTVRENIERARRAVK